MSEVNREQVFEALKTVFHPEKGKNVVDLGLVTSVVVANGNVSFGIQIDPSEAQQMEPVRLACEQAIQKLAGVNKVMAVLTADRPSDAPAPQQSPSTEKPQSPPPQPQPRTGGGIDVPGVKKIIAVASGKGGVDKSTTTVNLALALRAQGLNVGILDADIYGPSLPKMMGLSGQPESVDDTYMIPKRRYDLSCMSIGFFLDEDQATIWRGPMIQTALTQMLTDVNWKEFGELDVMLVDMPPGTGDVQLTMAQQVPLAGAVIVSTPQDVALIDARKGINMFKKVNVPILGIIENMSYFLCPSCGERAEIFGHGGARETAEKLDTNFLGEVPLHMTIREKSDAGEPVVATEPDSPFAKPYMDIAKALRDAIAGEAEDGPSIVFE